ncbi:Heptosyltransferase [Rhodotorula toruloides ATCC 204091]|uniref:Heptosyltransferase n=1 Tax=Rhodotorula toruloides TaxID=5286 RepID=A0A0K3CFQ3_RHOTO|nr:Heptosyltransferase [Rhodotorula toruloides ATCC 204091]KAK4334757.1 Heptosyltransferase [Rhodotorula toruloides]PRQ76122.1 Heptosyltransferase [Rhodotorula toruloides]
MGCCVSRQIHSDLRLDHGLVPPHLARQLAPFAFADHALYDPALPPLYSLECELLWRMIPFKTWSGKVQDEGVALGQLRVLDERSAVGVPVRADVEQLRGELAARVYELRMGYTVVLHARVLFLDWLLARGFLVEYAYQGLEEYAEGSAGGLSMYWSKDARQKCSEGAMVRADWLLDRFSTERCTPNGLGFPRLAFLRGADPSLFTSINPPPIALIPPRNPLARIAGLASPAPPESPPAYTPYCDHEDQHEPGSSFTVTRSSDSGHGDLTEVSVKDRRPAS